MTTCQSQFVSNSWPKCSILQRMNRCLLAERYHAREPPGIIGAATLTRAYNRSALSSVFVRATALASCRSRLTFRSCSLCLRDLSGVIRSGALACGGASTFTWAQSSNCKKTPLLWEVPVYDTLRRPDPVVLLLARGTDTGTRAP